MEEMSSQIRRVAVSMKLSAFAKASNVPLTTLVSWRDNDFRPKVVFDTFQKLAVAAERAEAAIAKADRASPEKLPRRRGAQ